MARRRRAAQYTPLLTLVEQGVVAGLEATGKTVLKRAKELVPEDTGKLKRSGRVKRDFLEVTVTFTAPHAALVHEDLNAKHENGGQAKYLEQALSEFDVTAELAGQVRRVLRG